MDAILTTVWQRLNPEGRLLISGVTIDTVAEVYQWAKENCLDLDTQVINVSQTQPLAHYQRYQAENPIHLFFLIKTQDKNCVGATHEQ
jgi:precorrin-6Y C5,15-methyltransferase (decarboxylating)